MGCILAPFITLGYNVVASRNAETLFNPNLDESDLKDQGSVSKPFYKKLP
jgi:hypothetical protein